VIHPTLESSFGTTPVPAPVLRLRVATPRSVERALAARGLRGLLSPAERGALAGIALERRRRDWIAGRLAVKRAVRAALRDAEGWAPAFRAISVLNAPGGAPCLVVHGRTALSDALCVSIAHDDGTALGALAVRASAGAVGVDIEQRQSLSLRLLRPVLTVRERRRLAGASPARRPPAIALWAIKEAVLKAAGPERCASPRSVELRWRGRRRVAARLVGRSESAHAANVVAHWQPWNGHVLAWATVR
jgi:4'-phosphopantetheinyl transferase